MADIILKGNNWHSCVCGPGITTGCLVHDKVAVTDEVQALGGNVDTGAGKVFEYECLILNRGEFSIELLSAMSTSHAFEEASYEFDGKCVATRRGAFLHDN